MLFKHRGVDVYARACWKTDDVDFVGIKAHFKDDSEIEFKLGLCPNHCYGLMVDDIMFASTNPYARGYHEEIDNEMISTLEQFTRID